MWRHSTVQLCRVKLKFHGTDIDTDFLADFRATILARQSADYTAACAAGQLHAAARAARSARRQSPRTFVRRALFLERMSVEDARVYTCTCTVHDKLSCTHLQNYTIGASLKSMSVSVSVPCNLSFRQRSLALDPARVYGARLCLLVKLSANLEPLLLPLFPLLSLLLALQSLQTSCTLRYG